MNKQKKFFNYNLPSQKSTSLILRGLDTTFPPQQIINELKAPGASNTDPFVTKLAQTNNVNIDLWLVTFESTFTEDQTSLMKPIQHTIVHFK